MRPGSRSLCESARFPGRWSATAEVQEYGRLTEQRSKAVVETVRELCQVKDVAGIFESDPPTDATSSCAPETPMHHYWAPAARWAPAMPQWLRRSMVSPPGCSRSAAFWRVPVVR
jgi:hypothetical protein